MELERQTFEAKSSVVVKDTEVMRLREELEAASQAKMFFEDELIALRDQNKAHADAAEEDPSGGNQRDLFEGVFVCASPLALLLPSTVPRGIREICSKAWVRLVSLLLGVLPPTPHPPHV